MNKHSYQYLRSHDIDLFFQVGNKVIHCATNGGMIPGELNIIKNINEAKRVVRDLREIIDINQLFVNERYLEIVVNQQRMILERLAEENETRLEGFNPDLCRQFYLSSFVDKACKGLFSYDRDIRQTEEENNNLTYSDYVLVVGPSEKDSNIFFEKQLIDMQELPFKDISDSVIISDSYSLRLSVDIPK